MMLFKEDPNRIERLLKKFSKLCDNKILYNCYKNKLMYGCGYPVEIEDEIQEIVDKLIEEQIFWWVELLD